LAFFFYNTFHTLSLSLSVNAKDGIVLEATPTYVSICDFGLTAAPRKDQQQPQPQQVGNIHKDAAARTTTMMEQQQKQQQPPAESDATFWNKLNQKFKGSTNHSQRERITVHIITEQEELKAWHKINYGGALSGLVGGGIPGETEATVDHQQSEGGGGGGDEAKEKEKSSSDMNGESDGKHHHHHHNLGGAKLKETMGPWWNKVKSSVANNVQKAQQAREAHAARRRRQQQQQQQQQQLQLQLQQQQQQKLNGTNSTKNTMSISSNNNDDNDNHGDNNVIDTDDYNSDKEATTNFAALAETAASDTSSIPSSSQHDTTTTSTAAAAAAAASSTTSSSTKEPRRKLPKSDPPKLVLARTRFLLEHGENVLPPYHILNSNSECIAVFCKTGVWSTLQASVFLHSTAIGNAKSSMAVTLGVAASVPFLAPVVGGIGLAMVGAPYVLLNQSKEKWAAATASLTTAFWAQAPNEVFVECIEHWSKLD